MEKFNKSAICQALVSIVIFGFCYFIAMHFSYFFLDEIIVLYTSMLSSSVVSIILISLRYFVATFFFFTLRGIYHSIKYRNVETEQEEVDKEGDIEKISRMLNVLSLIFYLLLLSLSLFFAMYYGITQINIIPFAMIREYMYSGLYIHLLIHILLFIPMGILIRKGNMRISRCIIVSSILFVCIEFIRYFFLIGNFEIDRILLYMVGLLIGFSIYEISKRQRPADLRPDQDRKLSYLLISGILFIFLSGVVASNVSLDGSERIAVSVIEAGNGVYFEINSNTGHIIGFSVLEDEEVAALNNDEFREFLQEVAREYFGEDSEAYQEFVILLESIY